MTQAPPTAQDLCDTIGVMKASHGLLLMALALDASGVWAQGTGDPIVVSSEHPRLFLRPARLRLLRREKERQSLRWEQFSTLMAGGAAMPEPGLALALYYEVAGDKESGRKAIAWAQGASSDLRQRALVFDWCYDLMSEAERKDLATRMGKALSAAPPKDLSGTAARALAAVALFDEIPDVPPKELDRIVRQWWQGGVATAIQAGANVIRRDDAYPLYELLHAVQDNVKLDLRESAAAFFKDFPIEHLMSYYPAPYQAAENDYYIGAEPVPAEPDLKLATMSRAAELAMVAYDPNSPSTQVLQGWLMHDKYLMRSAYGTPYEFLWANPYQPGLSYYHVPLVFYSPERGRLFIRSSWEDSADWFGIFDGAMQLFRDGGPQVVNPAHAPAKLDLKEAMVCFGKDGWKQEFSLEEAEAVFVVGLQPRRTYQVEIDDEEMFEVQADASGILELDDVPWGRSAGVRIH